MLRKVGNNSKRLKPIGAFVFSVLVIICIISYHSNHYFHPDPNTINRVCPDVLLLFPEKYEGIKVMFPMIVKDIQTTETGIIIKTSTMHGLLTIYCEEVGLARGIYKGLKLSIVGTCFVKSKGYVEVEYIHPHFYEWVKYLAGPTALLILVYYAKPHWLKAIKRRIEIA
jgi:hypothetical protein